MTGIDFGTIFARGGPFDIGGSFQQGYQQGQAQNVLAQISRRAQAGDLQGAASLALSIGDTQTANALLARQGQQQQLAQERGLRQQEINIQKQNVASEAAARAANIDLQRRQLALMGIREFNGQLIQTLPDGSTRVLAQNPLMSFLGGPGATSGGTPAPTPSAAPPTAAASPPAPEGNAFGPRTGGTPPAPPQPTGTPGYSRAMPVVVGPRGQSVMAPAPGPEPPPPEQAAPITPESVAQSMEPEPAPNEGRSLANLPPAIKEKARGALMLGDQKTANEIIQTWTQGGIGPAVDKGSRFNYDAEGNIIGTEPIGGVKLSPDVAGRVALGEIYNQQFNDIQKNVGQFFGNADRPSFISDRAQWFAGQGAPGATMRRIQQGQDALQRMLTGAGMGTQEAAAYAARYQPRPGVDTKFTALNKVRELNTALKIMTQIYSKGQTGPGVRNMIRRELATQQLEETGSGTAGPRNLQFSVVQP